MLNRVFALFFFVYSISAFCQDENLWKTFDDVTFRDVYIDEYESYASVLDPNPVITALDGTEISITGYHIPVADVDIVVLSKFSYSNCFFCGGAGQESVMDIRLKDKDHRTFELDEKLTFKGILKVNTTNWEELSFILERAELVE